ncbi:MAG: hypothetical protein IPN48_05360 [Sphingomonadales bacterium]|nr:hypothetical protein [Sphingomonadales bacterium]
MSAQEPGFVALSGRCGAAQICLSDLRLAGGVYLDRFIISAIEDVRSAGIVSSTPPSTTRHIICLAATVRVYQPQLARLAYREALSAYAMRWTRFRRLCSAGSGQPASAAPAAWIAARSSKKPEVLDAIEIDSAAPCGLYDQAATGLHETWRFAAASERDGQYAVFNIPGLILGVAGCLALPFRCWASWRRVCGLGIAR